MRKLIIINGPNLNLVGTRQPEIYGTTSLIDYIDELQKSYSSIAIKYFQSNIEGEIIDKLQEVGYSFDGILLNAGGYTHTSVAIADAVAAIKTKVVEIHISNPKSRETERHISLLEKYCHGTISGLGLYSYKAGVEYFNSI